MTAGGGLLLAGCAALLVVVARRLGWFLAAQLCLIALALFSLALGRAGRYSPAAAGGLLLLLAALVRVRVDALPQARALDLRRRALLAGLLLSLGLLYALFPTYYLLSGRDPGIYLISAVRLSRTGGFDLDLPQMALAYREHGAAIELGYPGIENLLDQALSRDPARMTPAFMQLFPALAASAHALFGLEGLVRCNALVAVLGLWAFFRAARELTRFRTAWLATLALGMNPVVIWHARITVSEILAFDLLFLGALLLLRAHRLGSPRRALCGGLVLGLATLNRIDAPVAVLLPLGLALVVALDRSRSLRGVAWAALFGFAAGCGVALLDGGLFVYPYLERLWGHGHLALLVPAVVLAFSLGLALPALPRSAHPRRSLARCTGLLGLLTGAWFLAAGLFLPRQSDGLQHQALRYLSWYATPIALVLALSGWWALLRRPALARRALPVMLFGAATTVLYTWRPSITHEHIWLSRRWLPAVIPWFVLSSAIGLEWIHRRLAEARPLAAAALVLLLVAGYGVLGLRLARPFLFTSLLADYRAGYAQLAAHLRAHPSPLPSVTQEGHVAALLTYVYDCPTVLLAGEAGRVRLREGGFAGWRYIGLDEFDFTAPIDAAAGVGGWFLEQTADRRPERLVWRSYRLSTGILPAARRQLRRSVRVPGAHPSLQSLIGRRDPRRGLLVSSGAKEGFLQYGPYLDLEPGRYRVTWFGRFGGEPRGWVDVVRAGGGVRLAHRELAAVAGAPLARLSFELERRTAGIEFRLFLERGAECVLESVAFEKD